VTKYKRTDDTADYCGKQDIRQTLIDLAYVHAHLQKKSDKIWVAHWAPEALKLLDFLSENRLR